MFSSKTHELSLGEASVPRSLMLVYCDLPPLLADGAWMAADLELP
jgi:hypothetical protein